MRLNNIEFLELPPSADMHVHLRQGAMMDFVVRQIRSGGVDTVMVCKVKEWTIYFFADNSVINMVILISR